MVGLLGNSWLGGLLGGPQQRQPQPQPLAGGRQQAGGGLGGLLGGFGDAMSKMQEENPEFLMGVAGQLLNADPRMKAAAWQDAMGSVMERKAEEKRRTADMEDWNYRMTAQGEYDRQARQAETNRTVEWARSTGDKDLIGLAEAGYGNDAIRLYTQRQAGGGDNLTADRRNFLWAQDDPKFAEFLAGGGGGGAGPGGLGKPPSGFMWDPESPGALMPIPGGPGEQIGAENAGRIGIADNFLNDLPSIREGVAGGGASGLIDQSLGRMGVGDQGRLYARIESGADALQRMLSGAGMPESEAQAYARRYMPSVTDTPEIIQSKLDQLESELNSQMDVVMRGRGGNSRGGGGGGGGSSDPLGIR